jgi:hypothetical protein
MRRGALEHGGEVPGFDQLAVDHSLAANGVEPGAMQEGTLQRVVGERLVEPGEGRGGLGQGAGERRIRGRPGLQPGVEHSPLSVCLCTPRVRCTAAPIAGYSHEIRDLPCPDVLWPDSPNSGFILREPPSLLI